MSIGSGVPYNEYTGNGVSTVYAFGFTLLDADDLVVTIDGVATSSYTVSGLGVAAGGAITFSSAPANGAAVLLERVIALVRATQYQTNGDLQAVTVNDDFDRLWLAMQQVDAGEPRALRVPEVSGVTALPSAAARANTTLGFDSDGNPTVLTPTSGSAADVLTRLADTSDVAEGDALIGVKLNATGAVATTVHEKLAQTVSVLDFGVNTTPGTTDMTAAFNSAFTALSAGGRLIVPPGTYLISSLLTVPANVIVDGSNYQATIIKQTGAFYALKMTTGSLIKNLTVLGTSTATGGIDISSVGWAAVENVRIDSFSGTGAIAVNLNECYRVQLSRVYIALCYNGLKFGGNVTTFKFNKGNISETNASGKAIDATSGTSIEALFHEVYFESCYGVNPIYSNTFGRIVFDNCGFEEMCTNSGYSGSIANPKIINTENPTKLYVQNSQFSGFKSQSQTYTGTLYVIYTGSDAPAVVVEGNSFTQNDTFAGLSMFVLRQSGKEGQLTICDNTLEGGGFATVLAAETALIGGIDTTYASRMFSALGNRVTVAGVGSAVYCKTQALETAPPTGFSSTSNAVISSTTAAYVAYTRTFPKNSFAQGTGLRLVAWGRRTGTAGNKKLILNLTDTGAATAWDATATLTTATSWRSEITMLFRDTANQSINILANDAAASLVTCALGTKDSSTYDLKLDLLLDVANPADSMTLDGLVLERI